MAGRLLKTRSGQRNDLWPVFLLLVVVMVPTIGVLWFVSVAMRNEQLASRQRLSDAYRTHLLHVQQRLDERWLEVTDELQTLSGTAEEVVIVKTTESTSFVETAVTNRC